MKRLVLLLLLLWAPGMAHAEIVKCDKSAACKAVEGGIGSRPIKQTRDLVCMVYSKVPEGSRIWLQLRKIGEGGAKTAIEPFVIPRIQVASGPRTQTEFCIGRSFFMQADEVYMCTQFPDGTRWFSARRRIRFQGTGAFERAIETRELKMCFGPDCPKHFSD